MGFTILGTGSALPKRSVSNDELSEFLDTSDEWIFTRTGIKSRHVCTTESLDDLAVAASERALQVSGIDASQLDLIVCSTTTGDHLVPAEACAVAERLGATCPAFDVSAACAGFVFALDVAEGYIARGRAKHVLVVAAEQMTRALDWTDRATCVLFGDGAGAAVIEAGGDSPLAVELSTAPDVETLCVPGLVGTSPFKASADSESVLSMNGRRVFKFGVNAICDTVHKLASDAGISVEDIDHFDSIRLTTNPESGGQAPRCARQARGSNAARDRQHFERMHSACPRPAGKRRCTSHGRRHRPRWIWRRSGYRWLSTSLEVVAHRK